MTSSALEKNLQQSARGMPMLLPYDCNCVVVLHAVRKALAPLWTFSQLSITIAYYQPSRMLTSNQIKPLVFKVARGHLWTTNPTRYAHHAHISHGIAGRFELLATL